MIIPGITKHRDIQWVDRGWYLATEFEKTPSINFEKAVALAKTHPGFIELMDERNILIYRNIYRAHHLVQFQELYTLIKNWKGIKLYFKGDEVDYDLIASGIQCYITTKLVPEQDGRPDGCDTFTLAQLDTPIVLGCIGCYRSGVRMAWVSSSADVLPAWFFFGNLSQQRVYLIKKDDLKHAVLGHLIEYFACPLLNLDEIGEFLERFPDRIDPRKDPAWEYNRQARSAVTVRYYKNPEVIPVSEEAYRAYLKRVL